MSKSLGIVLDARKKLAIEAAVLKIALIVPD